MFYDTIARFYDAENEFFTDDLAFYAELAEQYGDPIVDIGCGTGRVLMYLAQAGYRGHGIDHSPEMLAIANRKLQALGLTQVTLVEADILDYEDTRSYPLVLLPYNGFMHFREQNIQLNVLKRVRNLLAPDGVTVIDLPNAGEAFATQDDSGIVHERSFYEPDSGNLVMQQSVSSIDRVEQKLHVTWIYDEIESDHTLKRTVAPLVLRYVFASEMRLLLKLAGLKMVALYGDYEKGPFVDGCERMIVLAKQA